MAMFEEVIEVQNIGSGGGRPFQKTLDVLHCHTSGR